MAKPAIHPSGFEVNKGPYVTNFTRVNGTTARSIGAEGQDILIWSIYCRNHGTTESREFSIYDNYATSRTTAADGEFLIFRQHLSGQTIPVASIFNFPVPTSMTWTAGSLGNADDWIDWVAAAFALSDLPITLPTLSLGFTTLDLAQDVAGAMPSANWQFETPILARNGAYMVGSTDVDATVLWSYAGTSTPYDDANTPTKASKEKRAEIMPDILVTKGSYLATATSSPQRISECDCEIWGYSIYNTTQDEKMLRLIDGDDNNIMDVWIGTGWTTGLTDNDNVQGYIGTITPTLFKTPIYAKNGFYAVNRTTGNVDTTGLNSNFIYRELKTNMTLSVTGKR